MLNSTNLDAKQTERTGVRTRAAARVQISDTPAGGRVDPAGSVLPQRSAEGPREGQGALQSRKVDFLSIASQAVWGLMLHLSIV